MNCWNRCSISLIAECLTKDYLVEWLLSYVNTLNLSMASRISITAGGVKMTICTTGEWESGEAADWYVQQVSVRLQVSGCAAGDWYVQQVSLCRNSLFCVVASIGMHRSGYFLFCRIVLGSLPNRTDQIKFVNCRSIRVMINECWCSVFIFLFCNVTVMFE
jgi:hypothetical protein